MKNCFEVMAPIGKLRVRMVSVTGETVYRIEFENGKKPLVITRATHANEYTFWTSLPEGRQTEAEMIGPLISDHLKKNK